MISSPNELNSITTSIENTGGVFFIPAFSGLGVRFFIINYFMCGLFSRRLHFSLSL